LANPVIPQLFTDNKDLLSGKIQSEFSYIRVDNTLSIKELKDILYEEINNRKEAIINEQITEIKDYHLYDDINVIFNQIADKSLYDAPLMLEWNTWRAMTMLDDGQVTANLKYDDFSHPMSTAKSIFIFSYPCLPYLPYTNENCTHSLLPQHTKYSPYQYYGTLSRFSR
jgi:hypothetical protein